MEQSSGFPDDLQIVEVHWRWATWQEIYRLGSPDEPPKPPKGWGPIQHPWVILVPKANSRWAWAYSRTSKLDYPPSLEEIRLSHAAHQSSCPILTLPGTIQFSEAERFPVALEKLKQLQGRSKCDKENIEALRALVSKLKKVHKTSWNRPQRS